jgi:hypothetical protein
MDSRLVLLAVVRWSWASCAMSTSPMIFIGGLTL